jgi:cell shape-determining protein MreC
MDVRRFGAKSKGGTFADSIPPMQGLRFNHIYAILLLFCAASAFLLPRFVDPARAQVQNIYAPISRPALAVAQFLAARLIRQHASDAASPDMPRSDAEIRQENMQLRQELALLTIELQKLQERQAEQAKLGSLGELCTLYPVSAGDAGSSESLVIGGTSLGDLKFHMPAVFPGGLVGWLLTPGLTGTRVRLITDRGFRVTGIFARFVKKAAGPELVRIATDPVLVSGEGNNNLLIEAMPLAKAQEIHVNDWLLLDDSDWPAAVQGEPVGRVVAAPIVSRRSPGFAEIRLEPAAHLMQLHELMIVDKAK